MAELRKRDGRREPFAPDKIARSLRRAASAVGESDRLLSEELAAVATMVLEQDVKRHPPSSAELRDIVERVLMETGHARVARAYILGAGRPTMRPRSPGSRVALTISSALRECQEAWDRGRLVSDLLLEPGLSAQDAEDVADQVEARLMALGVDTVRASLLQDLVELELLERGLDDALSARQRHGVVRRHVDELLTRGGDGRGVERRIGEEVCRQYSLHAVFDRTLSDAHLAGEIEIDGLATPGRALDGTLDAGVAREQTWPALIAELVGFLRGIEDGFVGPICLSHLERALAPALTATSQAARAARELLLALSGPLGETRERRPFVLAVAPELPEDLLRTWFHRGHDPARMARHARTFVLALVEESRRLGGHLSLPLVRVLVEAPALAAAEDPAARRLARRIQQGHAERVDDAPSQALRVVGARVGVNVARVALRAGRHNDTMFLQQLRLAVETAVAAAGQRLRHLTWLDQAGIGPLQRLQERAQRASHGLPLDLPGRHAYHGLVVPVALDAAVQAVTEHEPERSEAAAELRERALAVFHETVPGGRGGAVRFAVDDSPWRRAELRFGRLDFASFPRGRDILRLSHDGEAFRYGDPERRDDRPSARPPDAPASGPPSEAKSATAP